MLAGDQDDSKICSANKNASAPWLSTAILQLLYYSICSLRALQRSISSGINNPPWTVRAAIRS